VRVRGASERGASASGWQSTTTTRLVKFEDFCVIIATTHLHTLEMTR
jgi:hypothetical protein